MSNQDRQVFLQDITPEAAVERMARSYRKDEFQAERIAEGVPKFETVSLYSFSAEHAVRGADLIIHFFLPEQAKPAMDKPEGRRAWMDYWLNKFPTKLSDVAKNVFEADYPRIVAAYTEELASWWFKAHGFGTVADPSGLADRFYRELDVALKQRS